MVQLNSKLKMNNKMIEFDIDKIKIRKATKNDVEGIFKVAASVGRKNDDPLKGFLMDDYNSNPIYFKEKFLKAINLSNHFYVAEFTANDAKRIVGFVIAYSKKNWLKVTPDWLTENHFRPDFSKSSLDNYLMLDKVAALASLNRQGIGSKLFRKLSKVMREEKIYDVFEEVIISPTPNLPSVLFKSKRGFRLASVRYEEHKGKILTTLVYHRRLKLI